MMLNIVAGNLFPELFFTYTRISVKRSDTTQDQFSCFKNQKAFSYKITFIQAPNICQSDINQYRTKYK